MYNKTLTVCNWAKAKQAVYETVLRKCKEYCISDQNETSESYQILMRSQKKRENSLGNLKRISNCSIKSAILGHSDSVIRGQIVIGMRDMQEQTAGGSWSPAQKINQYVQRSWDHSDLNDVSIRRMRCWNCWWNNKDSQKTDKTEIENEGLKNAIRESLGKAAKRSVHGVVTNRPEPCPAFGQSCKKYRRLNHFDGVCRIAGTERNSVCKNCMARWSATLQEAMKRSCM